MKDLVIAYVCVHVNSDFDNRLRTTFPINDWGDGDCGDVNKVEGSMLPILEMLSQVIILDMVILSKDNQDRYKRHVLI